MFKPLKIVLPYIQKVVYSVIQLLQACRVERALSTARLMTSSLAGFCMMFRDPVEEA